MTIDDILNWIAIKNVQTLDKMKIYTSNEIWERSRGAHDVLEELRHYILIKTNPHNREDIKKVQDSYE